MPHRCANCGKEFPSDHEALLKGCDACGAKKFVFSGPGRSTGQGVAEREQGLPPRERGVWPPWPAGRRDAEPDAAIEAAQGGASRKENGSNPVEEITSPSPQGDRDHDMVESIRILSPGSYELNIAKLADSDERVVGIGREGSYLVDLISMMRSKRSGRKE